MMEEKIASLERAVTYGLERGHRTLIVDLGVLSVLLRDSRQLRDREARTCKHLSDFPLSPGTVERQGMSSEELGKAYHPHRERPYKNWQIK